MNHAAPSSRRLSGRLLENSVLVGIALLGVVLRLRQWVEARSLWNDEVALAVNFTTKGFPAILTEPLSGGQSAPPGFLLATQLAVRLFGTGEPALRSIALLAGLATLVVAVFVARRLLAHPISRIAFVALVALSPTLIYYSNELKQYSTDVLALMLVLLLWSLRDHRWRLPILAIGGFFVAVFSLPGIIGLLAFALAFAIEQASTHRSLGADGNRSTLARQLSPTRQAYLVLGTWAAGIALHGWYTANSGVDRDYMQTWWGDRNGFPPESVRSIAELEWYPLSIMRLSWIGIGEQARVGSQSATGSLLVVAVVVTLFAVMIRRRRDLRSLLTLIIVLAWILAELRIYPTSGRLSLYLVPVVLLGVTAGLDSTLQPDRVMRSALAMGGVGFLVLIQMSISIPYLVEPLDDRDMKWIAQEIASRGAPTDGVIVSPGLNRLIGEWYAVPDLIETGGYFSIDDGGGLPAEITNRELERVWVISTHGLDPARKRVAELSVIGYQAVCVEDSRGTFLALLLRADRAKSADRNDLCQLARRNQ